MPLKTSYAWGPGGPDGRSERESPESRTAVRRKVSGFVSAFGGEEAEVGEAEPGAVAPLGAPLAPKG